MPAEIFLIILSFILVIVAAAGVVVPLLPGVPLAWLGVLLFAYATDFAIITVKLVLIFLGLTVLAILMDILMPFLGAKKYQASKEGLIGGVLGLLLGAAVLGPIGIVVGPFLGVFFGEMIRGKSQEEAMQATKGVLVGLIVGSAVKLALVLVMLG